MRDCTARKERTKMENLLLLAIPKPAFFDGRGAYIDSKKHEILAIKCGSPADGPAVPETISGLRSTKCGPVLEEVYIKEESVVRYRNRAVYQNSKHFTYV
jgi:hypothetical protein